MSKYKEIKKDFVTRTIENLENADINKPPYEFTNLVNSCFGLIVFPKSFQDNKDLKKMFPKEYTSYGLSIEEIVRIQDDDKSLGSIIIHLRNGFAHGYIAQEVQNDDIVGLCIKDKYSKGTKYHTEIHVCVEELRKLALFVAEKVKP